MFKMSAVGVTIAAIIKDGDYGVPQIPHIQRAVITLIKARKNTRIGISKINLRPMVIVTNSFVYSPIVVIGWKRWP
jgi:hypothetical protein